MQAVGGGLRESQQDGAPGRRAEALRLRLAQDFRAIGIGDDQAGVGRHDFSGYIGGNREIQAIAMGGVVAPFAIGAKIGD